MLQAYAREIENAARPKPLEEPPLAKKIAQRLNGVLRTCAQRLGWHERQAVMESERPAPLGRQAAEIHAKAAADQVRRAEQLCADCERGARSDALAAARPTVWGEGAVYRLAHASAKTLPAPLPARVREQRIALISRKPCPRPSRGASVHPTVPRS